MKLYDLLYRNMESKMTEISSLMGQFADKIMEQQTDIEMIHQHATETKANVTQVCNCAKKTGIIIRLVVVTNTTMLSSYYTTSHRATKFSRARRTLATATGS